MNDKYAHALEHALANWYYCGDNAPTEPVFNALSQGMKNGMQLLVPIEIPEAILKQLAEAGKDVLYVSGEESVKQIKMRADRLGTFQKELFLPSGGIVKAYAP